MITQPGTGAPPAAAQENMTGRPRGTALNGVKRHNLPKSLEPVVDKWIAANKEFYLGPENLFQFESHRIQYLSNPDIPTAPGTWHCDTRREANGHIPALNHKEIQDIATQLARFHKPTKWSIQLDYHCNYDCPMCPYHGDGYEETDGQFKDFWEKHGSQKKVVTKEDAIRLIDILKENGIKILSIQSAGEIFIYPYWQEVARYARDQGMALWSITNGSFADEKVCRTLKELGFTDMRVSLDAVSFEVYSQIRSKKRENYQRAMEAPNLLTKNGLRVNVHFVRQDQNKNEEQAFLEHWKKTDVDSISIANQFVYNEEGCFNRVAENDQKNRYIHGLCSKYGNFSSWNDGTIMPCCGATPVYTDSSNHGLPRLKLTNGNFNDCVQTLNQMMSDANSPFKKICARCSLYTIYSTEKVVDGWKVNITPERETWTRVRRDPVLLD